MPEPAPAGWLTRDPAPSWLTTLLPQADAAGEDIDAALELSRQLGGNLPPPGLGRTAERWSALAAVAAVNLTVARVLEAHADALAIIAEADGADETDGADGIDAARLTWGVFAADAPGQRLDAVRADGRWQVRGRKPWCSLGDRLDRALVTAMSPDGPRLFDVDLHLPSVQASGPEAWAARGLRTVTSGPVDFDATPGRPVGPAGWYVERPGFAWGGIGVAACWYGGAVGVARTFAAAAHRRPGDITDMHGGAIDVALQTARLALHAASDDVDSGAASDAAGGLLALRVRTIVAEAAERVLAHTAHALGPAPLAFDAGHAARVADLQLYVRQHHAERDLATLGALVRQEPV